MSVPAVNFELNIRPRSGWQRIDLRELWLYRELLGFLVWRDIKVRYKQTVLGGMWAVIQPLIGMVIFGVLLKRVTSLGSDGPPYILFVYAGLVPWTFFANAVSFAGNSLIGSEQMIRKIYFPRVLIPLASITALYLDMLISLGFMGILMLYYRWIPGSALLLVPLFMLGTFLAAAGIGMFLAALNVEFRDVKYVVPFFTQMAMFVTPVIYPLSRAPRQLRVLLAFNPMTGMVEGFRNAVLGGPIVWVVIWPSILISVALFVIGAVFFHRMERNFADVI